MQKPPAGCLKPGMKTLVKTGLLFFMAIIVISLLAPALPAAKRKSTKIQAVNVVAHVDFPVGPVSETNLTAKP